VADTRMFYSDQPKKRSSHYPQNKSDVKMDTKIYCSICGKMVAETHLDVLKNKDILEEDDRYFHISCIQRKLAELEIREPIKNMEEVARLMDSKAEAIRILPENERLEVAEKIIELSGLFFDNPTTFLYLQ